MFITAVRNCLWGNEEKSVLCLNLRRVERARGENPVVEQPELTSRIEADRQREQNPKQILKHQVGLVVTASSEILGKSTCFEKHWQHLWSLS